MDAVLLPEHTNVKYKSFVDLVVFSNMFVLHKRSVSRVLFNFSSYIIPQVYPLKPAFSFSANTSARRWIDVFIFGVIIKTDQNTLIRTYTYIGVYIVSKHYCCKKKKKKKYSQCYSTKKNIFHKYGVNVLKMLPSPEAPLNQLWEKAMFFCSASMVRVKYKETVLCICVCWYWSSHENQTISLGDFIPGT